MAAVDPFAAPDLSSGSASDALKNLLGYIGTRTSGLDAAGNSVLAGNGPAAAYTSAIANQNTATGLTPRAMAALRTQSTSGINDQYNSAARALSTNLLQRGAVGMGGVPSSGGDIARGFQPLYSAMEAAKTKANTDTIMADELAKQKSLYQNQQLALQAAGQQISGATGLFNSGSQALSGATGTADALAGIQPASLSRLLGTSLLSNALSQPNGGLVGTGVKDILHAVGLGGSSDGPPAPLGSVYGPPAPDGPPAPEGSVYGPPDPNAGLTDALSNPPSDTGMAGPDAGAVQAGEGTGGAAATGAVSSAVAPGAAAWGIVSSAAAAAGFAGAAAGVISGIHAWKNSSPHNFANRFVQSVQVPTGNALAQVVAGVNSRYAAGTLTSDDISQAVQALTDIGTAFDSAATKLGEDPLNPGKQAKAGGGQVVARQARQTIDPLIAHLIADVKAKDSAA